MINLLAIGLVLTSLTVASIFSPPPQKSNNGGEQMIVKNGHRAIVVEYADVSGDGNTKIVISPKLDTPPGPAAGVAQDADGKARDGVLGRAGLVLHSAGPRDLICDAYGKCKEKIEGVLNKAKDTVEDKVSETGEVFGGAIDKAKDLASRASHNMEQGGENLRDNAIKKVKRTGEVIGDTKGTIKEKGRKGKKEFKEIARRGKDVIFDVIRYMIESMSSMMGVIHLLGFAMAYGISVWVSFIMSHVLAGVLPSQQFGMVQSKMYPVYFKAMVGSIGLAFAGHMLGHRSRANSVQACNLLGSLLSVLVNLLFLEPRATKVMFQRMKLEKEEGRGRESATTPARVADTVVTDSASPVTTAAVTNVAATATATPEQISAKIEMVTLDERLKKLNSYSSLLNVSTLIGLTWYLVYLSQRLQVDSS